ncbi:lipopolysaccharide export system permease protein [Orbus hercynius]|uniref:Lipopolysaccharide export system permease protein LptF n=1 Tax=Orbus hercynius TaxID=593135 RepID=A0A495RJP8_9GAMM|nr:LPS export ABC transporter permease LptF [Orbus hercynius]RKS87520.1 lipopolysaccharide export system permease protein [Orbus hercynius]
MIIRRYIIKETFKAQLAILVILFMIFFSQKLIRIMSSAVDGDIPSSLITPLLLLGVSNMAQLILPLSLFLGILIAFGRFYTDSEMVAMYACGVKKKIIYQVVLFLSIITCCVSTANLVWFGPWSSVQEEKLVENAKLNPSLAGLLAGQFQRTPKGDSVIYLGEVERNNIKQIFIAQTNPLKNERPSVILSNQGKITHDSEGNQIIILDNANRYEGSTKLRDFRISHFDNYQAVIKPKTLTVSDEDTKDKVEQLSFAQLRAIKTAKAKAEYYWRISLIISVPLMAFLVIPLSASNPRQGRLARILPAMLLYLVYFLLESSIKAHGSKGRIDPTFWFNAVNGLYFILAVIFNLWDSIPMRKIRYRYFPARFAS